MIRYSFGLRQIATLFAAVGVAASVSGCGQTLVFAERDGVNLAIRTGTSTTPLEVNFGLNRTIATIVPPAGEKSGKPSGDAVSMFAGFQVDNTLDPEKAPLKADLQIDTQFASGKAATAVAGDPQLVAQIVNSHAATFSSSASSKQLDAWLRPGGGGKLSKNRFNKLRDWLVKRYPPEGVPPGRFLDDVAGADYETGRKAALQDTELMKTAQ
ncbi:MAG: hypothetical protein AAB403_11520 [Planctomycetota bacterium]